jgi:hypothetical protein
MTVAGRVPVRNPAISSTKRPSGRPRIVGMGALVAGDAP